MAGYYSDGLFWEEFKNVSGEIVPPFAAMVVIPTGEMRGTTLKRPVLHCGKPSTTFYADVVFNSHMAIGINKRGRCTRGPGPMFQAYDPTASPTVGQGYGIKPGSWFVFAGYPQCTKVQLVRDSTNKIMLGTLAPIQTLLCKSTADNAAGALATDTSDYKIYQGTAGSEADTGLTTLPAIYAREAISNNTFFEAHFINNTWYAGFNQTGQLTMYKAKLNGALATTDANATIDNVTAFGGGTAPSPTSATNTLDKGGNDNDDCVIVKDGTGYYLLDVMHHACD